MTLSPAWLDELRSRTLLSAIIQPSVKLTRAGREARAQADAAAAALGVRLGRVLSAQAGGGAPPPMPMPMMRQMEMASSVTTPIEPGEVTVRAALTVTFEIE